MGVGNLKGWSRWQTDGGMRAEERDAERERRKGRIEGESISVSL